ncbi:ATP-binding protein [Streptomyces sp. NPDC088729]|uniref:ATP-binding protein n=1 Tax=Streptomyces sp. NPDC088729 TaxID=3365876 RepID=UPI0038043594
MAGKAAPDTYRTRPARDVGLLREAEKATTREGPKSAAEARDIVTRLLTTDFCELSAEGRSDVVMADALLVTSELVTNALRHGGGLTGFSARITDDGLRIAVDDASSRPPVLRRESGAVAGEGGYGWPLVQRLTSRLSVAPQAGGKRIVAVVPLF